jgi:cysteinyl-tRNA synthetase
MRLYNTLTQTVETLDFPDGIVRMYVCGITPYDTSHLGHARVGIVYDTLRRLLEYQGCDVHYVQNVTDIDEPLFERARRDNVDWRELGDQGTERYLQALAKVNVPCPRYYVKATEVVDAMQPIIQRLIDDGHAYVSDGAVFYRVGSFPAFGEIFHAGYEEMLATANERGNQPDDPRKQDPLDFVLWQPSAPDEPSWPSPWGPGRPGWHIECSTIATTCLGPQIDIHGGGADLIFPHHAAEIAQAEPANGVAPFVRCWMHVGMIYLDGEKMSKSLGNMLFVDQMLQEHSADALRLSILMHRYRDEYEPMGAEFDQAEQIATQLRAALQAESTGETPWPDATMSMQRFLAALDEDFDTLQAIGSAVELAGEIIQAVEGGKNVRPAQGVLREMTGVLGLPLAA